MIALLADETEMNSVMAQNDIQLGGGPKKPKKIDMSMLVMSEKLKD